MPIRDLAEPSLKDPDDALGHRGEHLGAVQPGLEILPAAVTAPELAQVRSGRDTQQPRGEENGAVRMAFGWGVLQAPDAKLDWEGRGCGHVEG
jgi:hypothetical protein